VSRIPLLRELEFRATRLGGLSNMNYRLDTQRGSFVLRVPHPDPGPFVNRSHEMEAAEIAARLGIGPELVYGDGSGVLLTRWIDAAEVMGPAAYRADASAIARVAHAVSTLHRSGYRLQGRFDIAFILATYEEDCRHLTGRAPLRPFLASALEAALAALRRTQTLLVPSHCDLVPENCLDDGARMTLIDWEYAGMADPAWDLAYLAIEADFDPDQEAALLAAYGGTAVSEGRMQVVKMLAAAIGYLWAVSRSVRPGQAEPPEWVSGRLAIAERLARDPRLTLWIAAIEP
jgi:thiamine kinase-like enzyme